MKVVEVDGNYIDPFETNFLDLWNGQSYSVLITADAPPGAHRATSAQQAAPRSPGGGSMRMRACCARARAQMRARAARVDVRAGHVDGEPRAGAPHATRPSIELEGYQPGNLMLVDGALCSLRSRAFELVLDAGALR